MATATYRSRSRPRSTKTGARIKQVRAYRKWAKDPRARIRREVELRKELAREVAGAVRDTGVLAYSPIRKRLDRREQVDSFAPPATKREAKRHAKATHRRQQQPEPAKAAPNNPPRTAAATAPRSAVPKQGSAPVAAHTEIDPAVEAVVQQFVRAATALGDTELTGAGELDVMAQQLGKAMLLAGDALEQLADQVDGHKVDQRVAKHFHAAADATKDIGEHYTTARREFREVYEQFINRPDRMPELPFFENANAA